MKDVKEPLDSTLDENGFPTIVEDEEDSYTTPPENHHVQRPSVVKRELTEVSKKYDRHGKGFLDDAERALRNMDSENQGYLQPDQVFRVMESLQEEQKRSTELIDEIRREHKQTVGLKRIVIILTSFVFLLALSNIGTSFAAARLTKDMKVSSQYHDLVSLSGQRLGTTSKEVEFSMGSVLTDVTPQRRRHLQDIEALVCDTENSEVGYVCNLQGVVTLEEAVLMYQQFCPGWPNNDSKCQGSGVSRLVLNCNGVRSTIFGGSMIPDTGPTTDLLGYEYMIFPTQGRSYQARQALYRSNIKGFRNRPCMQDFEIGFYCPTAGTECFIFGSFAQAQCLGLTPELCGVPSAAEE